MRIIFRSTVLMLMFCGLRILSAQELQPPSNLEVNDVPNDAGVALELKWKLSPDDVEGGQNPVIGYRLERKTDPPDPPPETEGESTSPETEEPQPDEDGFLEIKILVAGTNSHTDENLDPKKNYTYRLTAIGTDDRTSEAVLSIPFSPVVQWINTNKLWFGFLMLVVCGSVVVFIYLAKSGRDLKIRKVAGLEAVEEAVGRATEMGRDVLFIPGIQDINEIQTIAGLIVLNRVAELTAEYDAGLDVPTTRSLVMTTARETVEAAYIKAGRPDLYNPEDIYYLTDEQFGFVAAVSGKMVREKPAACFYMGAFYAESLIFAETANTVGAIQIAGTAMPSQLPFFVAACDYVLIGEEFFAASAYLSGEPQQLGSLKGQDLGKLIGAVLILVGSALFTLSSLFPSSGSYGRLATFLKETLLGS
ncbi:MAG TPA: fibronectin type III domain-containing protein [Planctomycetaceae bacterium]|nr:fibronectin type III domain-containing protein [Planctomycetaceae bacterium]